MPNDRIETREGTISRIKWPTPQKPAQPGNTWRLLEVVTSDGKRQTWKGNVGDVSPGTLLRAKGKEVNDKYGLAFEIESLELAPIPRTAEGQIAWMAYRLPQVGEERAQKMVDMFGEGLWEVIEDDPQRLLAIRGLTEERIREICEAYLQFKAERKLISRLIDAGLRISLAIRAHQELGHGALEKTLQHDPYVLMDLEGITYDIIDPVALQLGISPQAPCRARGYARNELEKALGQGDCYISRTRLVAQIAAWGIPAAEVTEILQQSDRLTLNEGTVQLTDIARAEKNVAEITHYMLRHHPQHTPQDLTLPDWLDEGQKAAVRGLLSSSIAIMTGGPGTGKTTTLKVALELLERQGARIRCAAPTGKAARRMEEVTSRPASTIHRLLKLRPGEWDVDVLDPLDANVVVVDEASMIDIRLASALFSALGEAQLIIVGDADQLPPVGPGQPLYDLIHSEMVPVYRLTEVHRTAGDSWVVDNAYRIIEGEEPNLESTHDFQFQSLQESEAIIQAVVALYRKFPQVQVLTPEHERGAGTINLNLAVQEALNPAGQWDIYVKAGGYRIYDGDKVLYTKNNPQLNLVNGDVGMVKAIVARGDNVGAIVQFDGKENEEREDGCWLLEGADALPLTLAWAMTVHKSQGSEWPFVAIVADLSHWSFRRQLLYTAVTRTYERLSILGSEDAVYKAVKKPKDTNRDTLLRERLKGEA
jgi:exodeoxyribonuclease V alpha subunit